MDLASTYEIVEQKSGFVPKAIGKNGAGYAYLIAAGLGKLSAIEQAYAEEAKGAVIDQISGLKEEIGMKLFENAREIASRNLMPRMGGERANLISYIVAHDTVGYGPISILLEDRRQIEEIEINAPTSPISIFHVDYGRCVTNLRYVGEPSFRHCINRYILDTDKELSEDSPIIDAQVEDARVHAQMRPYAQSGAVASIRLADRKVVGFDYLVKKQTTDHEVLAYLWLAMDAGLNLLIAGPPASGKTTLMSALFGFVPRVEKVVTIEEDVNELKVKLDINNTVGLYGARQGKGRSATTRDQVINALRMRPDRLVVGEVRGEETRELFSGASLGVPFMTTMHSNEGGMEIVKRLTMRPMEVETRALSSLDIALYMRHVDLSRRVLDGVYEYRWLSRAETEKLGTVIEESDSVDAVDMVRNGKLAVELLPNSKVVDAYGRRKGIGKKAVLKELKKRAEFLRVVQEGCTNTNEMLEKIQCYGW